MGAGLFAGDVGGDSFQVSVGAKDVGVGNRPRSTSSTPTPNTNSRRQRRSN